MALSSRMSIPGNWPGASIQRMAFSAYIWSCENTSHSHLRMAQHSHLNMEETNPLTMTEWLSPYIWPWKEPILSPCQNGSRTHHFPLEGTSIWRTPRFSLKYSNFTLANGLVNTSAICSSVQHTGASLVLSAPYPWYSDIWSRYASTCHGTLGSLKTSHNSGCHNIYKWHPNGDKIN